MRIKINVGSWKEGAMEYKIELGNVEDNFGIFPRK